MTVIINNKSWTVRRTAREWVLTCMLGEIRIRISVPLSAAETEADLQQYAQQHPEVFF